MLHFARRQNSWFPLFKNRWEFKPTKTHTTHKWHSLRKHLGESNVIKTHRKVLKWIKLYLQNTLYTPSQKLDRELLKQKIRAFERIRQAQKVLFSYMPVEFDGQNVPLFCDRSFFTLITVTLSLTFWPIKIACYFCHFNYKTLKQMRWQILDPLSQSMC